LIYLTDLCCHDYPATPPSYPVLWITDSRRTAPFGETIKIFAERMEGDAVTTTRIGQRGKTIKKPDNLLHWQTWLEQELSPPLSDALRCDPELKRVLEAFLEVIVHVRRSQAAQP